MIDIPELSLFHDKNLVKSDHYFDRYKKLIDLVKSNKSTTFVSYGNYEKHHIFPRAIFPEFVSEKWNLVRMDARLHYLAHYLLYKSISHVSCTYAFNQMKRILPEHKKGCRLYAQVRKDFAKMIGDNNRGRAWTEARKKTVSEKNSGTNLYRNTDTLEIKRFVIGQSPAGWEPFQCGRERKVESNLKLGNKMRGRIWQYIPGTDTRIFDTVLRDGFVQGIPEGAMYGQDACKDTYWAHSLEKNQSIRVIVGSDLPDGYKLGRLPSETVGFGHINCGNKIKRFDLVTKTFKMVEPEQAKQVNYVNWNSNADLLTLFEYKSTIYTSYSDLMQCNPELPKPKYRDLRIVDHIIPRKHHYQTIPQQECCLRNAGKTLADIGLVAISVTNFDFNKNKEKIYDRHTGT